MIRPFATLVAGLLAAGSTQAQTSLALGATADGLMPASGPDTSTCYVVRLTEAAPIEATVRSDAFDPMISVGPGRDCASTDGWRDDDGGAATGGPLDARLLTNPLPAGDYMIRVHRADGRSGPYRLSAAAAAWTVAMTAVRPDLVPASFTPPVGSTLPTFTPPPPQTATVSIALDSGTARRGSLSEAGPGPSNCYLFQTRSQQDLEVIVRSETFDPIVRVNRGRTCNAPGPYWENDNGGAASGGAGDARMVLENREAGDYAISVRGADGRSGDYQVMAMTGTIHLLGSTALNSPTLAGSLNWQAEVREAARAEVATAVYAPPPRPAGYEGLSDGDLLQTLMVSVGDGPQMVQRLQAMDPVAKAWMRYHSRLVTTEYLAGANTWRDANPTSAMLAQHRAAEAQAQARAQAAMQQASASRMTEYERGVFSNTLWELGRIPDDGEGIRQAGLLFRATLHCGNITPYLPRMSPQEKAQADAECPWDALNRMNAEGLGSGYQAAQGTGNPISPFAPRDPGPGTGNVNVRTYDSRTGAYTGSTVMSPLEAELRGVRPQ